MTDQNNDSVDSMIHDKRNENRFLAVVLVDAHKSLPRYLTVYVIR